MKRTLENCVLKNKYGADTEGGKCFGVGTYPDGDESCEQCKECKLNWYYEKPEPIHAINIGGTQKYVKTRKEHQCAGCYRKFPIGTTLLKSDALDCVDNGGYFTWYICPVCIAFAKEVDCQDHDGTWYEGFAVETDREVWEVMRGQMEE
jgi:hypothetical protein